MHGPGRRPSRLAALAPQGDGQGSGPLYKRTGRDLFAGAMTMSENAPTPYDQVIYPGNPVPQSHPDRLATLATLYGMRPAPVPHCRVLELGCGIGGNLTALACQWPDSAFVGIDLSARSIEIGQRN